MATFTFYGAASVTWSYFNSEWGSQDTYIDGTYYGRNIGNIPGNGTYAAGQMLKLFLASDALPGDFPGVVTAATLHMKSYTNQTPGSHTVYFRLGLSDDLWTSTAPPNLQSQSISFGASVADYTVDLTTHFNNYIAPSLANNYFWLYAHRKDSDNPGIGYCDVYSSGAWEAYIEIEYTPSTGNSTIGLYDGSAFTDRIIKKRVSGAWVQCDCYKYNSTTSTWEKVSTT